MTTEEFVLNGVAAPVFSLETGEAGVFLAWNDMLANATGIVPADAIGKRPSEVLGTDGASLSDITENKLVHIGGVGTIWVQVVGQILVGTLTDREREAYLGMAAHDLRAPLRNILFLAEEAMHDTYSSQAHVAKIRQVARKAMLLTQDIVACTQAETVGRAPYEWINLKTMCDTIFSTIHVSDDRRLTSTPTNLFTERSVVQIVLRNLLDNAVKHGGVAIRIDVSAKEVEGGVQLSVADNGKGFAKPACEYLSGEGARVESGYGLIGMRRLVSSRGGSITVSNRQNGPGSIVRVTLPGVIEADAIQIAS